MHARPRTAPRGFTLIELLVVIVIIALISAVALPTILPALNERRVSESARVLQAILAGTRDAAIRSNSAKGIRLLPDPIFNGAGTNPLASNRIIPIEPGPDYNEGLVYPVLAPNAANPVQPYYNAIWNTVNAGKFSVPGYQYLIIAEVDYIGIFNTTPISNPTNWSLNIRQGDKLRFNDSGAYYTIAGPVNGSPFGPTTNGSTRNTERAISAPIQSTLNAVLPNQAGWAPGYLFLMNGKDDDGDGWIDEECDGIDNDGDGITDPGFNGIDDDSMNGIDDPAELAIGNEFEQEVFLGAQTNLTGTISSSYTIFRRPVVSPGARETTLPAGVVIDLTTWNASAATPANAYLNKLPVLLPERSRLPVDAFTGYVDIMIDQTGRVITPGAGMDGGGSYGNSPLSNYPFYHFWLTEREGVVAPIWPGQTGLVPIRNPNYGNSVNANGLPSSQNYMLPMPKGTQGYTGNAGYDPMPAPYSGSSVYLTGERRLVTLFVKTGQITSNSIQNFNVNDTNYPFYDAQAGTKESQ